MNLKLQTHLAMIRACLNVVDSPAYKPIWSNQPPVDFGAGVAKLTTDYARVSAKAAMADRTAIGSADARATAETVLEERTYVLTRALTLHFKRTGDVERRGKVNVAKSEIVKLRTQELVNRATAVRDLGAAAVNDPGAEGRGITTARVDALSEAIADFLSVIGNTRGQIVSRGTLLRDVETEIATIMDDLNDLDDIVLQFGDTDAGHSFVEAWRRARTIVDAGGSSRPVKQPDLTQSAGAQESPVSAANR